MIYMLVGIQGSGKSTFAKKLSEEKKIGIISTDHVRKMNPGIEEKLVWPTVYKQIYVACRHGVDAIFDATSITKKVRKRFFDEVEYLGLTPEVGVYNFVTPVDECVKRVIERNKNPNELFIPPEVVTKYASTKEEPTLDEGFVFIKTVKDGEVVETITK